MNILHISLEISVNRQKHRFKAELERDDKMCKARRAQASHRSIHDSQKILVAVGAYFQYRVTRRLVKTTITCTVPDAV